MKLNKKNDYVVYLGVVLIDDGLFCRKFGKRYSQ